MLGTAEFWRVIALKAYRRTILSGDEWIQYLKFEGGIKDFTTGHNNVNKEKYIVLENYPGFMFNSSNEIQRIDYVRNQTRR